MSKVGKLIVGGALAIAGAVTGNWALVAQGVAMVGSALIKPKGRRRDAAAATLQLGEVPRQFIAGLAATAGSLVDAFNYGGKYGTDWEVVVIALADHKCDGLEGFYVNDKYVAFNGDGAVAGYNGQLEVYFRPGTLTQTVPSILTSHGPGWTANDRGAGVCYAVVAYKGDASDAKNPIWTAGRPKFQFVARGALCYDPRKDSTVGGTGTHRWDNPSTREWSDNPIVCRYNFARGLYAGDQVGMPEQLLVGRGLSAIEAPPENVFSRANLCDEIVDGEKRYAVGGIISADESFMAVEQEFAAACAGNISQPEGAVEIDPGEAKAPSFHFTDANLVPGTKVKVSRFLSVQSDEWTNTVVANYIERQQQWKQHSAPVRRDITDIQADRGPREKTITLGFVPYGKQAGRIAEIERRLGRLWTRAEVTLPPHFCEIEEGDWGTWQSDRYLDGATLTFRVEAWGSDEGWKHSLVLRQISDTVYSDTAALTDGSVANDQPAPPAIGMPTEGAWTLSAGQIDGGGVRQPALLLAGSNDNPAARFTQLEYVQATTLPANPDWIDGGLMGPEVSRREIPVAPGGTYFAAVSLVVDGVTGDRRVLGPITAPAMAYPDGTPVQDLQPDGPGANRTQDHTAAAAHTVPGAGPGLFAPDLEGFDPVAAEKLDSVEAGATLGDTLVYNGRMSDTTKNTWWGTASRTAGVAADGDPAFFARYHGSGAGSFNDAELIPVAPGQRVFCSMFVRDAVQAGNNLIRFNPFFYRSNKTTFVSQAVLSLIANSAQFVERKGSFVVPDGAAFMWMRNSGFANTGPTIDAAYPRFAFTELESTNGAALGPNGNMRDEAGILMTDADTKNNAVTIEDGILEGIGTPGVAVGNTLVAIEGLASARPASGAFIGQLYSATDTGDLSRWTGAAWTVASDITSNAQVTFGDVAAFEVQADSASQTTTTLPISRAIKVYRGGVLQTSGVTVGTPTANAGNAATASVSAGVVTVNLTQADASGTVTVPVTFGGQTFDRVIQILRTQAQANVGGGAGGGSTSSPFSDFQWTQITSTGDVQVTDSGVKVESDASGELRYSASAGYSATGVGGTGRATIRAEYSLNDISWTEFEPEVDGSLSFGGEEPIDGFVSISAATKTGLTPNTEYYVRLVAKRSTTNGSISWQSPNFTVQQP